MGFDPASLPPNFLKLMSEKDRKSLGKVAQTPEETNEKLDAKYEKELQRDCCNLLTLRGIEYNVSRMDKKKTDKVGWPDITFAICGHDGYQTRIFACAIECKRPGKYLDKDQRIMREKMVGPPNAWTHRVIRSVAEFKMFLDGIGL